MYTKKDMRYTRETFGALSETMMKIYNEKRKEYLAKKKKEKEERKKNNE
jgi:hypothetical protein